jgi:hypothetical protein
MIESLPPCRYDGKLERDYPYNITGDHSLKRMNPVFSFQFAASSFKKNEKHPAMGNGGCDRDESRITNPGCFSTVDIKLETGNFTLPFLLSYNESN